MKVEKRKTLDFSAQGQPVAEPDNDLEWPDLAPAPSDTPTSLVADAPAATADKAPAKPLKLTAPAPVFSPTPVETSGIAGSIYWIAAIASALWLALVVAAVGFQWPPGGPPVDFQPYQIGIFAVFAIAPIGFIWFAAFGMRQGVRLAAEVVRTRALSKDMLEPAAIAAAEAGAIALQVRHEIEAVATVALRAKAELQDVRQGLVEQTEKLTQAARGSAKSANVLGQELGLERQSLSELTAVLDAAALSVSEAITRQAKVVSEASDLAQTQIGEAEAALAARAADLQGAAGDAGEAARLASEDLARQAARLETATIGVGDQIRSMEDTLTQQRASLVQVAHSVRADHEDLSIKIETQHMQFTETLANTQASIADLNESAAAAAETLGELATATAAQTKELAETVRAERDVLAATALQSLGALSEAAKYERETSQSAMERTLQSMSDTAEQERAAMEANVLHGLADLADAARSERDRLQDEALRSVEAITAASESARGLAEAHSTIARTRLEELGETAFAASQQAESAFQARLADANELIARSAELVDQAGAKITERIEQSAGKSRAMLGELEVALADFEARMAGLPQQTMARAEALKAQLATSFDDLLASARAAAEETQAIDAAFQERVRRNYEMLSEAVRLMGVVSGRPGGASGAAALRPTTPYPARPGADASPAARPPTPEPEPQPAARRGLGFAAPSTSASAAPTSSLRPRLKLAPTAADADVTQVFESAGEPAGAEGAGWTWQELLSSMDDAPVDDRKVVDRLIGEIEGLGVDADALLPPARIAEIAALLGGGDASGSRAIMRQLAPAAVRRLSRRTLAEPALRTHAERYVRSFARQLAEAVARKGGAPTVSNLLTAEEGRAFLLFDAALGDPG